MNKDKIISDLMDKLCARGNRLISQGYSDIDSDEEYQAIRSEIKKVKQS